MKAPLNFRDCGGDRTVDGRRVRTGMLFRSGSLDRLSKEGRRAIEAAHLRTIIDLRPDPERARRIAEVPGARRLAIPFNVDALARQRLRPFIHKRNGQAGVIEAMTSVYYDRVQHSTPQVRELFGGEGWHVGDAIGGMGWWHDAAKASRRMTA
jgi:hypothetical protein